MVTVFHIDPACFVIWGIPVCTVTLSRFDEVDVEKNITVLSHSGNDVCVGSREAFAEVDVVATHTAETTAGKDLGQLGGVCPVHNVTIRTPLQLPQVWINALKRFNMHCDIRYPSVCFCRKASPSVHVFCHFYRLPSEEAGCKVTQVIVVVVKTNEWNFRSHLFMSHFCEQNF